MEVYRAILGVNSDAGEDEIRRAYRVKALQLHPDVGGSSEQMTLLNEAYEVLTNFTAQKAQSSNPVGSYPLEGSTQRPVERESTKKSIANASYESQWLIARSVCSVALGLICFAESANLLRCSSGRNLRLPPLSVPDTIS